MVRALSRLGLVVALAVAPLACASAPTVAGASAPVRRPTDEQIKNRHRTLVAGLGTSLALGLVGLGTLLANANFAGPKERSTPQEMPAMIAVAGGIMSLGFLAAVPFAVGLERHKARYPEVIKGRPPRPNASLAPRLVLKPGL
jgi:hypothetical protein